MEGEGERVEVEHVQANQLNFGLLTSTRVGSSSNIFFTLRMICSAIREHSTGLTDNTTIEGMSYWTPPITLSPREHPTGLCSAVSPCTHTSCGASSGY